MEMQSPPTPARRSTIANWSDPNDSGDQAGHMVNGIGTSKPPPLSESVRNFHRPENLSILASLKSPASQRTVLSVAGKHPENISDVPAAEAIRSSQPRGSKLSREDESLGLSSMPMPTPMPITETSTAVAPGAEVAPYTLSSQAKLGQSPAPVLALQVAAPVALPLQDALESEVQVVYQDLSQPESKVPTVQQRPLLGKIWSFPKAKLQWPEPEASIGRSLQALGANKCWEVKGPAREISDQILPKIKDILASCSEELNVQESVPLPILFGMYMVGKDERNAAPVVLFSCQSRTARRKAMKIVKESNLLQSFEGVLLAEHPEAPISLASDDERSYISSVVPEQMTTVYIAPAQSTDSLCGKPIFIRYEIGGSFIFTRVATMGGVLQQGDTYYGLTIAHSFQRTGAAQLSTEDPVENSFDDSIDISFGDPVEISFDDSDDAEASSDSNHPPLSSPHLESYTAPDFIRLGCTKSFSSNNELDYALIDIELQSFFKASNKISFNMNQEVQHRYPQDISNLPTKDCQILAATGSKGVIRGEMSGVIYFIKMPFGKIFQEVRLIRLESTIEHGDCGSWIVDLENGNLYGPVIAGYPKTRIAYIISARAILEDIKSRTDQDVRLSQSRDVLIKESFKTPYPPNPPLIHNDGRILPQGVLNAQTATELPADLKPDQFTQTKDALMGLVNPSSLWTSTARSRTSTRVGALPNSLSLPISQQFRRAHLAKSSLDSRDDLSAYGEIRSDKPHNMTDLVTPGQELPSYSPPSLPQGWIAQWDDSSKKYYFVQLITGMTQWEKPTESAPTVITPAASPGRETSPFSLPGQQQGMDGQGFQERKDIERRLESMVMNQLLNSHGGGNLGTQSNSLLGMAGQLLGGKHNQGLQSSNTEGAGIVGALAGSLLGGKIVNQGPQQNYSGQTLQGAYRQQQDGLIRKQKRGGIFSGTSSSHQNTFGNSESGQPQVGYTGQVSPSFYQPGGSHSMPGYTEQVLVSPYQAAGNQPMQSAGAYYSSYGQMPQDSLQLGTIAYYNPQQQSHSPNLPSSPNSGLNQYYNQQQLRQLPMYNNPQNQYQPQLEYNGPPQQQQQPPYGSMQQQDSYPSPIYVGPTPSNLQQPKHHMFQGSKDVSHQGPSYSSGGEPQPPIESHPNHGQG